ncbi:Protein CBG25654 [Caenorhabditis briggsae]|uniref:Protein CBG25654 n=1 Tax=Caenorhabditis briggsae TaxID=6238 RepID=B6IFD8_CAEBR|nr:Protein CBG25654 [Caenorhabditis briggsae]CAR98618.1 Protein CBG25654 [Caenorhabditis briggsae]
MDDRFFSRNFFLNQFPEFERCTVFLPDF